MVSSCTEPALGHFRFAFSTELEPIGTLPVGDVRKPPFCIPARGDLRLRNGGWTVTRVVPPVVVAVAVAPRCFATEGVREGVRGEGHGLLCRFFSEGRSGESQRPGERAVRRLTAVVPGVPVDPPVRPPLTPLFRAEGSGGWGTFKTSSGAPKQPPTAGEPAAAQSSNEPLLALTRFLSDVPCSLSCTPNTSARTPALPLPAPLPPCPGVATAEVPVLQVPPVLPAPDAEFVVSALRSLSCPDALGDVNAAPHSLPPV